MLLKKIRTKIEEIMDPSSKYMKKINEILSGEPSTPPKWFGKTCGVVETHAEQALVHIYEETDLKWHNVKLKKFLCMGTLISPRHVLTTKLCFGSIDE